MTGERGGAGACATKNVNLFSDLALHRMGTGLADGILQGSLPGTNSARRRCGDWVSASSCCTMAERAIW